MSEDTSNTSQPLTTEEKREALRQANRAFGKLVDLELELQVRGETDRLEQVKQAAEKLKKQIDRLRKAVAQDWTARAGAVTDQLGDANAKIQRSIREIRNQAAIPSRVDGVLQSVNQITGTLSGLV